MNQFWSLPFFTFYFVSIAGWVCDLIFNRGLCDDDNEDDDDDDD